MAIWNGTEEMTIERFKISTKLLLAWKLTF